MKDGLVAAAKADVISLTAFEVGLFWLLMQVGMIIGFVTSWPANVWLVKRGIAGYEGSATGAATGFEWLDEAENQESGLSG